ncbi:MAG: hypothetical protein U0326_32375 [Polyangiales bacterium]
MTSDDARKLFVAGLPDSVTEVSLRQLFSESGAEPDELSMPRDRATGRPRGFAFARFATAEDAERARAAFDGRILDGRAISVRPYQSDGAARRDGPPAPGGDRPLRREPAPQGEDRTLYVGNLPYDATPEEVEASVRARGADAVVRVHLPVDQDGRKRGFGFVTLASAEAAKAAVDALQGADLRGRRLVVNIAAPKGAPSAPRDAAPRSVEAPRFAGMRTANPPAVVMPTPSMGEAPANSDGRRRKRFEGPEGGGAKRDRRDSSRWGDDDDE